MNIQTPKVSVIIPIYGVEKYIERCARSLFEQTLDDIEYIFVNDCTPDASMDVLARTLEDYPNRQDQVRIINHNENKGIAYTRKEGIKEAKSEYIGWCDSDDWCEPDMISMMYAASQDFNSDIVVCGYYIERKGTSRVICQMQYSNGKENLLGIIDGKELFMSLWMKMIRKSLLLDNDILPYEGINIGEDLFVCLRAYYFASNVTAINAPLYHYNCDNVSSATSIRSEKDHHVWEQQVKGVQYIENFINEKPDRREFKLMINYVKFVIKTDYRKYSSSPDEYFYTFKECHKDILLFRGLGPINYRLKLYIIHSSFFAFKLYCRVKKQNDNVQ